MGWWLRIIYVSYLSICLDRNIYPPQYPTRFLHVSLTEVSLDSDPGFLKRLQYWAVDDLTIFYC